MSEFYQLKSLRKEVGNMICVCMHTYDLWTDRSFIDFKVRIQSSPFKSNKEEAGGLAQ